MPAVIALIVCAFVVLTHLAEADRAEVDAWAHAKTEQVKEILRAEGK